MASKEINRGKPLPMHFKILVGIIAGIVWGIFSVTLGIPTFITLDYIAPFGEIFINLLKMIAVPLVIASLIIGIANLSDISKLSRIGGRTVLIYLITTVFAITIGLVIVNVVKPGVNVSPEAKAQLMQLDADPEYNEKLSEAQASRRLLTDKGPLQPLVDMVPDNFLRSAGDNAQMLKVVFFAIFFGVALLSVPKEKSEIVIKFFDGVNEVLIQIITYIMKFAPYGVFALMAEVIVKVKSYEILYALFNYTLTVIAGLAIMVLVVYPLFLWTMTKMNPILFFKGIRPAWALAFSTSSSSATLPITMRSCEENLGVSKEVSSFVLPLGATINMDGTSLYQAVAAVFIAQFYAMDLTLGGQVTILFTALLASIGTAGVPGVGIVMLTIVLSAAGIPEEGLILILATDRILDMMRTVVNVTGDSMVASIIAGTENKLDKPEWEN